MGVQPVLRSPPRERRFSVVVLEEPDDPGHVVRQFSELGAAMEWAGQHWYETDGDRPYDIWVRCERSGRLHFAPRLRIRMERGDDEAFDPGYRLERPPVP
jgi:hypothetical protein